MEIDVLDRDFIRTRVSNADDDPLGIRIGTDVSHGLTVVRVCVRFWELGAWLGVMGRPSQ